MSDLRLREAARADAPDIAEIEKLCFSSPWSLEAILYELDGNESARYIVRAEGRRVVAYAGLRVVLNEGHITNLAVHPDFRGRGIGAAVLKELIERTRRDDGLTDFTLEVRASNAVASRLYASAGFRAEGRRRGYYTEPLEDAIIMWLHTV
ncbi:MAG: ribosomal protein S18-alanine N-acetyltransferase [Clostridiales Family XIII bacterium]|nr:ribosomal protein S18-alanine N-acetyltransferase [Clostridiales Family XIII bacterium]